MNGALCNPQQAATGTPRGLHGCRCGVRWSGYNICHCAATGCHQTFTGITAFDKHRAGNKRGEKPGECSLPSNVGLVANQRGQWGNPGDDNDGRPRRGEG